MDSSPLYQIFKDRTDRTVTELADGYTPPAWPYLPPRNQFWAEAEKKGWVPKMTEEEYQAVVKERMPTEQDFVRQMALRLSMGKYTSFTDRFGCTVELTTCDGQAVFSPSHTVAWSLSTYSNMDHRGAKRLSLESFQEAWTELPTADTLITSDWPETMNAAKELLAYLNTDSRTGELRKEGQRINMSLIVIPELVLNAMGEPDNSKRCTWFLADLKNSRAHFKLLPTGQAEICILSPYWIYGSFLGC